MLESDLSPLRGPKETRKYGINSEIFLPCFALKINKENLYFLYLSI